MPVFTAQVSNLQFLGPILNVQIAPSKAASQAMDKAGVAVPAAMTISAMIDTGATSSVVKTGLAQQLNAQPVGLQHINTPSSQGVPCYEFFLQLILQPTGGLLASVELEARFIEAPLHGQNIHVLLGRDVLSLGIFIYNGANNSFTLSL